MDINQKHLLDKIDELEKSYVDSLIELIKVPVFNKRIEEDMKATKDKDRIKALEETKEKNKLQERGHKESLKNLEEIITEAKKLIK